MKIKTTKIMRHLIGKTYAEIVANPAAISERMLAEDLCVNGCNRYSAAMSQASDELERLAAKLEAAEKERDALCAKIEQMEKQEPVAWAATDETCRVVEALSFNQSRRFDTPLYLLPGAKGESE